MLKHEPCLRMYNLHTALRKSFPFPHASRVRMQVGSVIRNAEVQQLVPTLLAAIAEPNTRARPALDTLIETVFVHDVDAASLALIVPVLHRGLRDRSGDAKKKAGRIVGNMCELINDPKVCLLPHKLWRECKLAS